MCKAVNKNHTAVAEWLLDEGGVQYRAVFAECAALAGHVAMLQLFHSRRLPWPIMAVVEAAERSADPKMSEWAKEELGEEFYAALVEGRVRDADGMYCVRQESDEESEAEAEEAADKNGGNRQ